MQSMTTYSVHRKTTSHCANNNVQSVRVQPIRQKLYTLEHHALNYYNFTVCPSGAESTNAVTQTSNNNKL